MSGSVRVGFSSNIEEVIQSVDDVKDDLRYEMRKRVGAAMLALKADVTNYIVQDPDYTGQLLSALSHDETVDEEALEFVVGVDMDEAPYAAIVELGSGKRTNIPYKGSQKATSPPDEKPIDYPFSSPDIPYNEDNPADTAGYPKFYGFVKHIEEWMRNKPVSPHTGSYFFSAVKIAETIIRRGNYAHPYLRPAWFDNELQIKKAAKNAVRNAVR